MIIWLLPQFDQGGQSPTDGQQRRLHDALSTVAFVQRIHNDAGRTALGKGMLFVIDKTSLQRKGIQHTHAGITRLDPARPGMIADRSAARIAA